MLAPFYGVIFRRKIRNWEQIGGILVLRVAVDINIGEDAPRHVLQWPQSDSTPLCQRVRPGPK